MSRAEPKQTLPARTTCAAAALTGRTTAVKLDAGFVAALTSLKVTPGAVGDAKITKAGSAVFPITGGNVKYYKPGSVSPYVQGSIMHDGSGLSLEAGGKKVELTDFMVDPGRSVLTGKVSVDGKVAVESAPLFFLDGRTLQPLEAKSNGTAVLQGTTVKLNAEQPISSIRRSRSTPSRRAWRSASPRSRSTRSRGTASPSAERLPSAGVRAARRGS